VLLTIEAEIKTSNNIREADKTKMFSKLVKLDKWKSSKPKEDPNLITLIATIKTLTSSLQASKSVDVRNSNHHQFAGAHGSWKYDPSLGSDGIYSPSVEGKDPKTYKWH
jgi:hypothetical protein